MTRVPRQRRRGTREIAPEAADRPGTERFLAGPRPGDADAGQCLSHPFGTTRTMIFMERCAGCDTPGAVLCRTCRFALLGPAPVTGGDAIAAVTFNGRARDVLLGLKYRNRRQVAGHLAGLLVNRLVGRGLSGRSFDVVTWAPTSTARRHDRGFDQAEADRPPGRPPARPSMPSVAAAPRRRAADRARPIPAARRPVVHRQAGARRSASAGRRRCRHDRRHAAAGRPRIACRGSGRRGPVRPLPPHRTRSLAAGRGAQGPWGLVPPENRRSA